MFTDSHTHLNFSDFGEDLESIITKTKEAGVSTVINIGTSLEDSKEAITLAQKHDFMFATVGIHPNDSPEATEGNIDWMEFENLCQQPKVVAVGECGLDYSRIQDSRISVSSQIEIKRQRQLFQKQIEIAKKLNLPLSLHVRDAYEDMIEIIKATKQFPPTVFHCFSGTQDYLDFLLTHPNFFFSFAGNLTYKTAQNLRDFASQIPLDRILIETDAPFLTPVPLRGSKNTPANVTIVAEKLAEIRNLTNEEIAQITTENTRQIFNC